MGFVIDENGEIVPMLAKSYDVSDDGKVYTFYLRDGIKFHDDTEFNAEAVKCNLERYQEEDSVRSTEVEPIESVETVDEYTVRVTLSEPLAPFLAVLTDRAGIMASPKAIEENNGRISKDPVGEQKGHLGRLREHRVRARGDLRRARDRGRGAARSGERVFQGVLGEWIVMRAVDSIQAFPILILALVIAAVLGGGLGFAMIAIGIAFIPNFVRITRAQVVTVRGLDYVEAARAVGATNARIMIRLVLPNSLPPLLVQTTLAMGYAIIAEATLSYLSSAWWMAFFPGMAIFFAVLGFNLLGDGVREALDPRTYD